MSDDRTDEHTSLRPYVRELARHPTPWILGGWAGAAATGRVTRRGWTWRDPAIVGVLVALEPFSEWVIHVTLLHFTPRFVGGRTIDLHLAQEHRKHHLDPRDVGLTLIPLPELIGVVVGVSALAWRVAIDHGDALTVMATVASLMGAYEWTHYLIHSDHRPRSRHFRAIRRAHRLHHFRNERYWMGITSNVADRVLGTFPERSEVELSPTARTLGAA